MTWFLNHYRCPRCGRPWSDAWSATSDDDCPDCGERHISPTRSEDRSVLIEENPDGTVAVFRSPDTAEHKPDYQSAGVFPTRAKALAECARQGWPVPVSEPFLSGRPVRPATKAQSDDLAEAVALLREARDLIRRADCPAALKKVRSALKSAEGAERHMIRRRMSGGGS